MIEGREGLDQAPQTQDVAIDAAESVPETEKSTVFQAEEDSVRTAFRARFAAADPSVAGGSSADEAGDEGLRMAYRARLSADDAAAVSDPAAVTGDLVRAAYVNRLAGGGAQTTKRSRSSKPARSRQKKAAAAPARTPPKTVPTAPARSRMKKAATAPVRKAKKAAAFKRRKVTAQPKARQPTKSGKAKRPARGKRR